jgi:hypothetical protein
LAFVAALRRCRAQHAALSFNHARVHAFEDGDDAFEHHFAQGLFLSHAQLDFSRDGKKKKIGGAHAIDGGDKRHGDAAADFADVVQMLHHLN